MSEMKDKVKPGTFRCWHESNKEGDFDEIIQTNNIMAAAEKYCRNTASNDQDRDGDTLFVFVRDSDGRLFRIGVCVSVEVVVMYEAETLVEEN